MIRKRVLVIWGRWPRADRCSRTPQHDKGPDATSEPLSWRREGGSTPSRGTARIHGQNQVNQTDSLRSITGDYRQKRSVPVGLVRKCSTRVPAPFNFSGSPPSGRQIHKSTCRHGSKSTSEHVHMGTCSQANKGTRRPGISFPDHTKGHCTPRSGEFQWVARRAHTQTPILLGGYEFGWCWAKIPTPRPQRKIEEEYIGRGVRIFALPTNCTRHASLDWRAGKNEM
jgi:hypothetical protein